MAFAQKRTGGVHGALVIAVSPRVFWAAPGMLQRKGVLSLNGLPPGNVPLPIFDVVLKAQTVRGSIVGTRKDLEEALQFASEGAVKCHVHPDKIDNINAIFDQMPLALSMAGSCSTWRTDAPSRRDGRAAPRSISQPLLHRLHSDAPAVRRGPKPSSAARFPL